MLLPYIGILYQEILFEIWQNIWNPLIWIRTSFSTFFSALNILGQAEKNLDSAFWPTSVPQIYDTKIGPRYNGRVTIGFLFILAFQNICYMSQKKISSLRNVSFSHAKENLPLKFMGFSIGINLDWNNILMKVTKGAYNNLNSKFGVFNNWSL